MNKKQTSPFFLLCVSLLLFLLSTDAAWAKKEHPCLVLTKQGVEDITANLGKVPLFDKTLAEVKIEIDQVISQPIEVPYPKDAGGGYTHERHKKNYMQMYHAGILYQVYKDKKYAFFVQKMLKEYADMYPSLPLHPVQKSKYRGKLFWQGLNECVWLVHASQAYDCIYDFLSAADRTYMEKNLFYPMVKFISEDNYETFNKIHNHGTWAVAGVGMIGYVMDDKDIVDRALLGSDKNGKTGFLRQTDLLFSPDGYFTEGPYYQRYSLQPFIVFGQVIQHNDPSRAIFAYRDSILVKAVNTSLQLAYTDGQFFHLNDALDKTWHSVELVYGVDIAYPVTKDAGLLSIAEEQGRVILSDAGLRVAKALARKEQQPYALKTSLIRDGARGDEGGIGVLRMGEGKGQTCVVFKATAQGMGHGHFDKLSISFYDNGKEILQDYGAARFLNIEPKNGGHYLPENDTWAKQTIAHNTLVADETSHYGGELNVAEKYAPTITNFIDKPDYKLVSASESNAYPGIKMSRTVVLVKEKGLQHPVVIDYLSAESDTEHRYDLPFYFMGQLIHTDFPYQAFTTSREPLGTKNGYQYLWKEAEGKSEKLTAQMTFLNGNRFYTITSLTTPDTRLYLNRIGAGDPNFNLRNEPAFMLSENARNKVFVSVIEPHGEFNPREEYTIQPYSAIKEVNLSSDKRTVEITTVKGEKINVQLQ